MVSGRNVSKFYGAQDVLHDINLEIHQGERTALVGPNGSGKTTLLRILAGLEPPSGGAVRVARGVHIGYFAQQGAALNGGESVWRFVLEAFEPLLRQARALRQMEAAMAAEMDSEAHARLLEQYGRAQARFELAGGYSYESRARQALQGLGFTPEDDRLPLAHLSSGQQARVRLARLLLEAPDVLLLDEPTNHLDLPALEWLENALLAWQGAVVVVAHDRYFLDKLATRIWELEEGRLEHYNGAYHHYVQQRAQRHTHRLREFEEEQQHIAQEEEFIRRNIAGQRSREAKGRRKRLERAERIERPQETKTIRLSLNAPLRSGDLVLATYDLQVGYDARQPLLKIPDVEMRRGERIALLGPNGAGKTTFIRTIVGDLPPLEGVVRIGAGVYRSYLAQTHTEMQGEQTALEALLSYDRLLHSGINTLTFGEARSWLARFLFTGDDVFKPLGVLSGGERSRVALAKLAFEGANFLILDEPTNHLDIASREILQQVLAAFQGTILLVTHDRYLVDALATQVWLLEEGTLTCYRGGYAAHLEARQAAAGGASALPAPQAAEEDSRSERELAKSRKREQAKRARRIAELEAAVEALEQRVATLGEELQAAGERQDVGRLQELADAYRCAEEELAALLEEWVALEAA